MSCSVVVPVRNDDDELRGLLQSLSRQTQQPLEIIVVDNGSRDGSVASARTAGCVIVEEPVPGIARAATAGYDAAKGDLIVRCDADSRPPPAWIAAHARAHASSGRDTVIVTGPGWFRLPAPFGALASVLYLGGYALAAGAALGHAPAFGSTMSMRRTWWHEVRGDVSLSEDVHDDMDLSFRVRPGERVAVTSTVGVDMSPRALRPGPGSLRRWSRAVHTLRRNWHAEKPWERWHERLTVGPGRPTPPEGSGNRE